MDCSQSFERIGTTAYGYVTVVNASQVRQTGHVIGDFSVELYDPNTDEISGEVTITLDEFEVSGSPTGVYRFSVPIPSDGDEGLYTLIVTDPLSRVHSCVFLVYNYYYGGTEDTTAQLKINIRNTDGSIPSNVIIDELTVRIYNPDMVESSGSLSPTLDKLEDGEFVLGFDIGSDGAEGDWFVDVIDDIRFPQGKQGVWVYRIRTSAGTPKLSSGVNDGTGTSVTLTYIADIEADTIYTYYRTVDDDDWTLADKIRIGSGVIQITGLSTAVHDFYGVGSQSGSPTLQQSVPSNLIRISVYITPPSAADDNIKVAIKAMKQKAVYWPPAGPGEFGKPTWGDPVEIDCRWEDVIEEFIAPNGDRLMSSAKFIIDRDLKVKGVMWLGVLDNVYDADDPKNNDNAWEILRFMKTPDFKGKKYLREVYL